MYILPFIREGKQRIERRYFKKVQMTCVTSNVSITHVKFWRSLEEDSPGQATF